MLQRKASSLTPMERLIQRVATRVLKARFDEAQLDTVVMVSERMVIAALLGISAEKALDTRQVEKTLRDLGGDTGIKWKPLVVSALRQFVQVSDTQMEDLIGKLYVSDDQNPAYIAGKLVADPSVPVKGQLARNTRAIASTFKLKVENLAKDLVKSNPFKLDQSTESMFDESGNQTTPAVQGEMMMLDSWGDDLSDADTFLKLVMFDNSRLAQEIREYVLPLIKNSIVGHFLSNKKAWTKGWAEDMFADSRSGMFVNPPAWNKFKAAEYLREWVYTKVRTPQAFNQIANKISGSGRAMIEGKNLVISGLRLGSALGGKSISYLMTCSFGSDKKMFQSKIHNVYVNGSDLVIVNWTKSYGDKPVDVVGDVHFLNMKTEATFINDRIKKYPKFIESIFFELMDDPRVKKELFAKMLTSQTFARSLQAKLKKASEIRKNKHTNVPF